MQIPSSFQRVNDGSYVLGWPSGVRSELQIHAAHSGEIVGKLTGEIAQRIAEMFSDKYADKSWCYNCFGALRFALGKVCIPNYPCEMPRVGVPTYVHDAVHTMPLPFVFQVCGNIGNGQDVYARDVVLHAGLVCGIENGEPVVFEKVCARSPRIVPFTVSNDLYFVDKSDPQCRAQYVLCAPVNKVL